MADDVEQPALPSPRYLGSITDIVEWEGGGLLDLSPDFQRRSVWTPACALITKVEPQYL